MKTSFTFLLLTILLTIGIAQPDQPIRQFREVFEEKSQSWQIKPDRAIIEYGYDRLLDEDGKRRINMRRDGEPNGRIAYEYTIQYHPSGVSRYSDITSYNDLIVDNRTFRNSARYIFQRTFNDSDQVVERTRTSILVNNQIRETTLNKSIERYEYTSASCTASITYLNAVPNDTLSLFNHRQTTYEYYDNCKISRETNNNWNTATQSWQPFNIETYTYNERGDLHLKRYDVQPDGSYFKQDSITYEYFANGAYQAETLTTNADGLMTGRRVELFDSRKNGLSIEHEEYDELNQIWIPSFRERATYTLDNQLARMEEYAYWNKELNDFTYQETINYSYNEDNLPVFQTYYRAEYLYNTTDGIADLVGLVDSETIYLYDCDNRLEIEQTIFNNVIGRGTGNTTPPQERTRYEYITRNSCFDDNSPYKITFYPNPATDVVRIKGAPDFADADTFIQLIRTDGTIIKTQLAQYAFENVISLQDLARGVYFVRVVNGEHSFLEKIYKH